MRRGANPETGLMQAIREALAVTPGVVVWRNNVGAYGPQGAKIFYGLAPGSADLVGIVAAPDEREIHRPNPAVFGLFFSLEVKRPGGHTDPKRVISQARWRDVVRKHGGFYAMVRSVDESLAAVECCRHGQPWGFDDE